MKLGFDKDHVINMPMANIFMAQRYEETFKQVITQHPDIIGATGASSMPGGLFNTATVHLPAADDEDNRSLEALGVYCDYFSTMGIELAAGRNFTLELGTDPAKAIIINETAVQTLGLTDPVGKTIEFGRNRNARTVVGVVKDFHLKSIHQKIEPLAIFPSLQPGPLGMHPLSSVAKTSPAPSSFWKRPGRRSTQIFPIPIPLWIRIMII